MTYYILCVEIDLFMSIYLDSSKLPGWPKSIYLNNVSATVQKHLLNNIPSTCLWHHVFWARKKKCLPETAAPKDFPDN